MAHIKSLIRIFEPNLQKYKKQSSFQLSEEETQHLKSFRIRPNERFELFDGKGLVAGALLNELNLKSHGKKRNSGVDVELIEEPKFIAPFPYKITLAVAFPKANERSDWLIEKATEVGVNQFIPLLSEHSNTHEETVAKRTARWERLAISACKQCLQPYLPSINPPTSLQKLVEIPWKKTLFLLGDIEGKSLPVLWKDLPIKEYETICMLVGPEGGFSQSDMNILKTLPLKGITLGPNRLRVETASISLTSCIISQIIK